METEFYKMDLHIHTPASKCYLGSREHGEYISILQSAYDKNIRIIGITDHNTIDGYVKLKSIQNDLKNQLQVGMKFIESFKSDNVEMMEKIQDLHRQTKLFEDILIIPGVEITVNPGVHILVLTKPNNEEMLSRLLDDIGYSIEKRGEDKENVVYVDVIQLLNNELLKDMLVIAPHVDGKNGIFNDIKKGTYRANVISSPVIIGFTCNNYNQLSNIKGLINNDPNYKRIGPTAFINASDAHKPEDIGSKVSFINLENITFEDIIKAFKRPEENISDVSNRNLIEFVKTTMKEKKTFVVERLDDKDDYLSEVFCACLNSDYKGLIIGVSKINCELIGVKLEREELEEYIENSIMSIESSCVGVSINISIETMGNGRNVAIVKFKFSYRCIWNIKENDNVYIIDNDNICVASINVIEDIVINNTLDNFKKYEENRDDTIKNLVVKMGTLEKSVDKYFIIDKITRSSVYLRSFTNLISRKNCITNDKFKMYYNGSVGQNTGNVYYVRPCEFRYDDVILRYSCPKVYLEDLENKFSDIFELSKPGIIICKKGGSHIVDMAEGKIVGIDENFLYLSIDNDIDDKVSLYSVIGWLKSSVLLWYIITKFGNSNIYTPNILVNLPFPKLDCLKPSGLVEEYVKRILTLERHFVDNFREEECIQCEKDCSEEHCAVNMNLDEHNEQILEIASKIDSAIISDLELTKEQIEFMKNDIQAAGVFNIL